MTQAPHVPANLTDLQQMHAELQRQHQAALAEIRELVGHLAPNRTDKVVSFTPTSTIELHYKGRHHAYLLLPAAATLTVNFPGMMGVALSFSAGWNNFDFPDGTQFSAASAVSGMLRLTNEYMTAPTAGGGGSGGSVTQGTSPWVVAGTVNVGNANPDGATTGANSAPVVTATDDINLKPGTQGWIAATGTGTAGQDDAIAFASQVRAVFLYNASPLAVPFEFDQTSTANSVPLQPGQGLIFDHVYCTNVHVFPSALLPINTANGLYVKGWT